MNDYHHKINQFGTLISASHLEVRIQELGKQITEFYQGKPIIILGVLKGSFIFVADLVRSLNLPVQVDFIGLSSYEGTQSTQNVKLTTPPTLELKDKDVVIVEDIIDSGLTMAFLVPFLKEQTGARSIKVCTLLSKPAARKVDCRIDWAGFEIGNEFVIGYGLDFNEEYRQLPFIALYNEK